MRIVILWLFTVALACFAADVAPPPVFPTELKLIQGPVLRNLTFERFGHDYVVVRYNGTLTPIQFIHIDPTQRAAVFAYRDALQAKSAVPAKTDALKPTVIEGQAFIVTQGAGSYKLGGMTVYALPLSALSNLDDAMGTPDLGPPLGSVETDGDGRFKFKLPTGDPCLIFAHGSRRLTYGIEFYEWAIKSLDIGDASNLLLTNSNLRTKLHAHVRVGEKEL